MSLVTILSVFVAFAPAAFGFRNVNLISKSTLRLNAIQDITNEAEFLNIIESSKENNKLIIIEYAKSLCKPCKKCAPEYEKLSEQYENASFFRVDADAAPGAKPLMKTQGIRSVPTFHLWLKGNRLDTVNGAFMEDLQECIDSSIPK